MFHTICQKSMLNYLEQWEDVAFWRVVCTVKMTITRFERRQIQMIVICCSLSDLLIKEAIRKGEQYSHQTDWKSSLSLGMPIPKAECKVVPAKRTQIFHCIRESWKLYWLWKAQAQEWLSLQETLAICLYWQSRCTKLITTLQIFS